MANDIFIPEGFAPDISIFCAGCGANLCFGSNSFYERQVSVKVVDKQLLLKRLLGDKSEDLRSSEIKAEQTIYFCKDCLHKLSKLSVENLKSLKKSWNNASHHAGA